MNNLSRISAFFCLITLISCSLEDGEQTVQDRFENTLNFTREKDRLVEEKPSVLKTVRTGSAAPEKAQRVTPDWEVEMRPFISSDINKTGFLEDYEQVSEEKGDWKVVTYSAIDPDMEVKKATYYHRNGKCEGAHLEKAVNRYLYTTYQEATYFKDSVYRVYIRQEVRFLHADTIEVKGVF